MGIPAPEEADPIGGDESCHDVAGSSGTARHHLHPGLCSEPRICSLNAAFRSLWRRFVKLGGEA